MEKTKKIKSGDGEHNEVVAESNEAPESPMSTNKLKVTTQSTGLSPERIMERKRKQAARSDRKRQREKKRRSDVNRGFDDLIELLGKIDPIDPASPAAAAFAVAFGGAGDGHEGEGGDAAGGSAPCNRVSLISRANTVLARLYDENQQLKKRLQGTSEAMPVLPPTGPSLNNNDPLADEAAVILVPVMIPMDAPIPPNMFSDTSNPIKIEDIPQGSIFPTRIHMDGTMQHTAPAKFGRVASATSTGGGGGTYPPAPLHPQSPAHSHPQAHVLSSPAHHPASTRSASNSSRGGGGSVSGHPMDPTFDPQPTAPPQWRRSWSQTNTYNTNRAAPPQG